MVQPSAPRKGSMGFSPRKRATSETPRFNSWPEGDGDVAIQGFAGYKAGMTHVVAINDNQDSHRTGMEETVPVTIVETPPMGVAALRAYEQTGYGLRPVAEAWAEDIDEELERTLDLPSDPSLDPSIFEDVSVDEVRAITYTRPSELPSIPKKRPAVMETRIGGGSIEDRLEYGIELLEDGAQYDAGDTTSPGEYLDASGVTKGKGTQGPVKRWGVQKRKGKHARQGWRRRIGNLGPWNPSRVRSTVPQQGQTGYHQRTELNKRLIDLGGEDDINPDGGFVNYGEVAADYALIKGSLPGPKRRLVRFRPAIRPTETTGMEAPDIRYVSTASQQG